MGSSGPSYPLGYYEVMSSTRVILAGLRAWPARRWVAAGALLAPMMLLYASVGLPLYTWWGVPVTVLQAALAAVVVASYVPPPGSGRRVEAGCTPCAVIAGFSVLGSLVMRETDPWDLGIGLVAVLLLGYGVVKRVTDTGTCAVR